MSYVRPFTFFVGAAGGPVNLLQCGVCNLIPLVGQVALLGYRAEVADDLSRDPGLSAHPQFDFGRFGHYLRRGLRPFAYQLIVVLPVAVVLVGGGVVAVQALHAADRFRDPYLYAAGVGLGWLLLVLATAVATAAVLCPLELHAQLSRRFAPAEAVGFVGRFLGKVWGQLLVALVAFVAGSFVIGVCGLLAFGVGLYLAGVVQFMAQQHLMTQLYRVYLGAGGEPIRGPDDGYDDGTD